MKVIILSIVTLLSGCSDVTKVKNMCEKLREDYKALQKQLPIQSDITTSTVGIEAFYLSSQNECFSTVTLNIDVVALVNALSKNDAEKKKKLSAFFKTETGKAKLLETINSKFNKKKSTNEFPTKMKGFTFKEIYSISGVDMGKVILEHKY